MQVQHHSQHMEPSPIPLRGGLDLFFEQQQQQQQQQQPRKQEIPTKQQPASLRGGLDIFLEQQHSTTSSTSKGHTKFGLDASLASQPQLQTGPQPQAQPLDKGQPHPVLDAQPQPLKKLQQHLNPAAAPWTSLSGQQLVLHKTGERRVFALGTQSTYTASDLQSPHSQTLKADNPSTTTQTHTAGTLHAYHSCHPYPS